jgi:hypothetical protein
VLLLALRSLETIQLLPEAVALAVRLLERGFGREGSFLRVARH